MCKSGDFIQAQTAVLQWDGSLTEAKSESSSNLFRSEETHRSHDEKRKGNIAYIQWIVSD